MQPSAIVRQARRDAGLTQKGLADRMGVSQPVIARLERAGSNPRVSTLAGVAAATGHSLELSLGTESGIDEPMVRADLRRSPEERLQQFEGFYRFAKELGGAALSG